MAYQTPSPKAGGGMLLDMLVYQPMYISIVKIDALPGQEHTVMDVLESMRGPISALAGSLGCSLTIEVGAAGTICYQEQWRDREALDRHLRSALYSRVLAAMELSRTPPVVEFFEATRTGGLDVVELARASHLKPHLHSPADQQGGR
jgi:quinol monooxygenase YgiN